MTKSTITNRDYVSFSKTNFADVFASYTLPLNTEDKKDFPYYNCIVVLFSTQSDLTRKYLFCEYFEKFEVENLMEIEISQDKPFMYILQHSNPLDISKRIRKYHSIPLGR